MLSDTLCVFLSPFLKFHVFEAAIYANKEVYNNIRVPIEGGVIRCKSLKYASACKRVFCITSGLAPSSGIVCRLAVDETGQSSRETRTQVARTHTQRENQDFICRLPQSVTACSLSLYGCSEYEMIPVRQSSIQPHVELEARELSGCKAGVEDDVA